MRQAIKTLGIPPKIQEPHRGLLLDTFLDSAQGEEEAKRLLMDRVTGVRVPTCYRAVVDRWKTALEQLSDTALYKGQRLSPILVGLGSESVSEVNLTLHRTYGVPYLPGSALKGLAASYARNRLDPDLWGLHSEAYRILFGQTDEAGYITFHDALMIPDKEQGDLRRDVLTVHHQEYYGKGTVPPADWDSPIPVPMLVAHADFIVPLSGPPAWREAAHKLLRLALKEEGIGAKTSSGYGRIELQGLYKTKVKHQTQPSQAEASVPASGGLSLAEQLAAKFNNR